jgi:peptidoglycan/LPS O-acetylase OafA/YrhL
LSTERRRLDGVGLLRGLAIFFVLMNHVNMRLRIAKIPYTKGLPDHLVNSLVWNGEQGVRIFFAISGFLITTTALRRWGRLQDVSPRKFYLLRFARIAPLLLLLLAILSALHLAGINDFVINPNRSGLGRALLAALTFHVNLLEAQRGYLPGNWDILWSLSVEEVFYFGFPLLCWALGRTRPVSTKRWFIAVLITFIVIGPFGRTVLAGKNSTWQDYSYLGGMDGIALGCLTAVITWNKHYSRKTLGTLTIGGFAIMFVCLCFRSDLYKLGIGRAGLDLSLLAIATCMLITAAAQLNWKSPRFLRPLASLGERSYEIYLTHMFVVFAFFDWFMSAGKPMSAIPWLFIVTIVVAAFLGTAVARWYSEPLNRTIRSKYSDEREPQPALVSASSA